MITGLHVLSNNLCFMRRGAFRRPLCPAFPQKAFQTLRLTFAQHAVTRPLPSRMCPKQGNSVTTFHFSVLAGLCKHPLHGRTLRDEGFMSWHHFCNNCRSKSSRMSIYIYIYICIYMYIYMISARQQSFKNNTWINTERIRKGKFS